MNRDQKRVLKMFNKGLEDIYKGSKGVAKSFDMKSIHIVPFRKIIDLGKFKPELKKDHDFYEAYNKTVDKLYEISSNHAKKNGSENIPLTYIRQAIDILKKAFNESVEALEDS